MSSHRVLFRFSKERDARYLSHRDLMRLFERALRRAALPLRMTQGFNPHPKMSILLALPLGVEADEEAIEVHFDPPVEPAEAAARLNAQLPPGIRLHAATPLEPETRLRVESVLYEAWLPRQVAPEPADIERFLARSAIPVERSTPKGRRTLDVRPALEALSLDGSRLAFGIHTGDGPTPRPREILVALLGPEQGGAPEIRVRRTRLNLAITSPGTDSQPVIRKGIANAT